MSEPGPISRRRVEVSRLTAVDMTSATSTWSGKQDLYHSYQALLFPSLPLSPTADTALARRRSGAAHPGQTP